MTTMPAIGSRVRYQSTSTPSTPTKTCTGLVVGQYPEYTYVNAEGETQFSPAAVSIQIDSPLPDWWPYPGTDRFAPDISEVDPVN